MTDNKKRKWVKSPLIRCSEFDPEGAKGLKKYMGRLSNKKFRRLPIDPENDIIVSGGSEWLT